MAQTAIAEGSSVESPKQQVSIPTLKLNDGNEIPMVMLHCLLLTDTYLQIAMA
jgi:hypothetical protein